MGDNLNIFFETFMAWTLKSEVFDLSGRDIIGIIIGFLSCLVLWALIEVLREDFK